MLAFRLTYCHGCMFTTNPNPCAVHPQRQKKSLDISGYTEPQNSKTPDPLPVSMALLDLSPDQFFQLFSGLRPVVELEEARRQRCGAGLVSWIMIRLSKHVYFGKRRHKTGVGYHVQQDMGVAEPPQLRSFVLG